MKSEIMIQILFMLLARRRVTAEEVSRKFDVSKRSVYRYMDELSLLVPLYVERGMKGGFSIMDDFRLPATFLTEKEYGVVLQALDAYAEELPGEELGIAINKLKANSKSSRKISLNSSTLMIDSGPWGITDEYNNKLHVLAECVETSRAIYMEYRNVNGVATSREAEPHTLVLKQGIWYVYAYCRLRGEFRLFKVGRIEHLKVLDGNFERRSTEGLSGVFGYNDESPKMKDVVFEAHRTVISDIEEWLGVGCVQTDENGKATVRARLPVDDGLASKLLGYGGRIRVIEPKELRDKIADSANAILAIYRQ